MSDNSFGTHLRALVARRDQRRRGQHRQRRHDPHGEQPLGRDVDLAERRHHARRQGRFLADQRRAALLGRLLHARRGRAERHEHRRRAERAGLSWGWFEGGFRPTTTFTDAAAATGHSGQPTSTFIPDEFAGSFDPNAAQRARNQGLCDAVHPVGVALGGTGQWGFKDDYIPHHEPFQYYASTANPHHLTVPTDGAGRTRWRACKVIGTDTQSYVERRAAVQHPEPPLRHQRLRPAGGGDQRRRSCRRPRCRPSAS